MGSKNLGSLSRRQFFDKSRSIKVSIFWNELVILLLDFTCSIKISFPPFFNTLLISSIVFSTDSTEHKTKEAITASKYPSSCSNRSAFASCINNLHLMSFWIFCKCSNSIFLSHHCFVLTLIRMVFWFNPKTIFAKLRWYCKQRRI